MTSQKKDLLLGGIAFGFAIILLLIFTPLFNGNNALNEMDNLYNSISKGSVYYIPRLIAENEAYKDNVIDLSIVVSSEKQAKQIARQVSLSHAKTSVDGTTVNISGSLGSILASSLQDAKDMFANNDNEIRVKYGYGGKQALYNWWVTLKLLDKGLSQKKLFGEAQFVGVVQTKGVECAYNYYKIEPQDISNKIGFVIFSLLFYVVYTLWFGYGILFIFLGLGFQLGH